MKRLVLITGLSMLLLVVMVVPAAAQEDVGVEVGDWFEYERKITQWESTMEFLPPDYFGPLSLADNETNWVRYTVTDIVDDTINFTVTYNWKNGTETEDSMVENVTDGSLFAIGANMTEGEMVSDEFDFFGTLYPARYLNASIMLDNPNATRETNVLNYSINLFGNPYDYFFYWDKETGMRVYYENHGDVAPFGANPAYVYTVVWELVDSSVEDLLVPDLTVPILLLTMISITVPIVLLRRRKYRII